MTDLYSRLNNDNTSFTHLVEKDVSLQISAECAQWLKDVPIVQEIGYNPFVPLSSQPDCYAKYFALLEKFGVSTEAEEYLPTRAWFMLGTVSAPLLLTAALIGKGALVEARAGDFPAHMCEIIDS